MGIDKFGRSNSRRGYKGPPGEKGEKGELGQVGPAGEGFIKFANGHFSLNMKRLQHIANTKENSDASTKGYIEDTLRSISKERTSHEHLFRIRLTSTEKIDLKFSQRIAKVETRFNHRKNITAPKKV